MAFAANIHPGPEAASSIAYIGNRSAGTRLPYHAVGRGVRFASNLEQNLVFGWVLKNASNVPSGGTLRRAIAHQRKIRQFSPDKLERYPLNTRSRAPPSFAVRAQRRPNEGMPPDFAGVALPLLVRVLAPLFTRAGVRNGCSLSGDAGVRGGVYAVRGDVRGHDCCAGAGVAGASAAAWGIGTAGGRRSRSCDSPMGNRRASSRARSFRVASSGIIRSKPSNIRASARSCGKATCIVTN